MIFGGRIISARNSHLLKAPSPIILISCCSDMSKESINSFLFLTSEIMLFDNTNEYICRCFLDGGSFSDAGGGVFSIFFKFSSMYSNI